MTAPPMVSSPSPLQTHNCFCSGTLVCFSTLFLGILVLFMGYLSYVWDISLIYWGISLMNWGISLMYWIFVLSFWKKSKSHVTRVKLWRSVLSYVWDSCLMYWDICLMYGILVLCIRYYSYVLGISLKFLENFKITEHPGATMAARIVLCLGY